MTRATIGIASEAKQSHTTSCTTLVEGWYKTGWSAELAALANCQSLALCQSLYAG